MPAGRRPCFMAPEATWSGISGFRLRYESCRAKERGAGVAIRILSLPAGDSGERSIPCPGLTVCPRGYRRRRAVDCRGPAGPVTWSVYNANLGASCGSSFLRAGGAMPLRWLAPGIIFRPNKSPWQGSTPRRGRREEGSATCCHPNPRGSTRDGHGGRTQRRRHAPTRAKGPK